MKRDCLAMSGKMSCRALDKTYCVKEHCKFYLSKKMREEQIKKIRERIPDYAKGE